MLGFIVLFILLSVEIGLGVYSLVTKSQQKAYRHIAQLAALAVFLMSILLKVIVLSFRWQMLLLVLLIQGILGIVFFVRKRQAQKPYKTPKTVFLCIGRCVLLTSVLVPAIIFPQYKQIASTGKYTINTASYTLTDTNRTETYHQSGENRKVTIQFWYPEDKNNYEQYPLVVFSHGAFGFKGSNYSTFAELASNGYVVCSIDHTYQSFFSKQADGKMVIVDTQFLNDAAAVQNNDYDEEKTYNLSQDWLKIRMGDMNFVVDTILENAKNTDSDFVYQQIDIHKIGLIGHSLGGATAAALGRERSDIDAVIVLDGTMLGEAVDFADGKEVLIKQAYPIPLLNIYNEEHYKEGLANAGIYANMVASANALDARQIVFNGAGHLNFTDLPMFSPTLAKMLGTGSINSRYCIVTMNHVVLDYFNHYLKDNGELNLSKEY